MTTASILVVGKESVGKSRLVAALTGKQAYSANFRGSTISCEVYQGATHTFVDTPGIVRQSDSRTTAAVIERLAGDDTILLVAQATHLDDDISDLLPLMAGKRGVVAVTFWDKVDHSARAFAALAKLSAATGVPFIPVDARDLSADDKANLLAALDTPTAISQNTTNVRAGWRIEPPAMLLEWRWIGPLLALILLFLPAVVAVWAANRFAGLVDPLVQSMVKPAVDTFATLPAPWSNLFAGRYGLISMGPLLFVWALPTVILYALLLGGYKTSGLLDRMTAALHPLTRPIGLSGRDVVRVLMGFGCNVPAVINTRSCSACSRGTCIAAIAFGSACSYQLGATLAVFAAAGKPGLVWPYLGFLGLTTLIYTRLTAPKEARSPLNLLVVDRRAFLHVPRPGEIWREMRGTLSQFFRRALPIFVLITFVAALLDWIGVIPALGNVFGPLMSAFRLPVDAALPVVLASIRKDGLLLFAEGDTVAQLSSLQILTGVYLAGVLLPCLVTALTIAREQSWRFAGRLLVRQAAAAIGFTLVLAWGGTLF